jgi:hypothetical protein
MAHFSLPRDAEFGSAAFAAPCRPPILTHEPLIGPLAATKPAALPAPAKLPAPILTIPAKLPQTLSARLAALAPLDRSLSSFLNRLEGSAASDDAEPVRFESTPLPALPIDAHGSSPFTPVEVRELAQQFQRRQRQTTMLVVGCVAICSALTVLALVTLIAFSSPLAGPDGEAEQSASIIWKVMPAQLRVALGAAPGESPKQELGESPAEKILASP